MSKLLQRLNEDLKAALKNREQERADCIRMVLAKIKEKQVEPGVQDGLEDDDVQKIIASYAKQRKDSAEAFDKAGRVDLRDKELRERKLLDEYLPQQMDDAALRKLIIGIVRDAGGSSLQDLGMVMGRAMKEVQGRAEGQRVQKIVREILGG